MLERIASAFFSASANRCRVKRNALLLTPLSISAAVPTSSPIRRAQMNVIGNSCSPLLSSWAANASERLYPLMISSLASRSASDEQLIRLREREKTADLRRAFADFHQITELFGKRRKLDTGRTAEFFSRTSPLF